MDSVLVLVLGTSGAGVIIVGIVGYVVIPLWVQRLENKRARETAENAEIAYRREICTDLLASLRDYFIALEALRDIHDNLIERWKLFHPAQRTALGKLDASQTVLARTASALSLTAEGKKVQNAGIEYLRAGNDYIQALIKPMQQFGGRFRKGDPQELARLREIYTQKHIELEKAASLYVSASPSKPSSKVKQMLTSPKIWVHNIRPKKRGTS